MHRERQRRGPNTMSIQLDHTIVSARDPRASAAFFVEVLGLAPPVEFGPFHGVALDNGVTLDFIQDDGELVVQHYAFRVGDAEFDAILKRIRERGLIYSADPAQRRPGEIDHAGGVRRVYWDDPNGHRLEIFAQGDSGAG